MGNTAPRVFINLGYQLFNGKFAVADNMTRHTFRRSNQTAIDYQQSVILSFQKAFNHNIAAVHCRVIKCGHNLFIGL